MNYRMNDNMDDPQITSCERTGYPTWHKAEPKHYCEECGVEFDGDTMYEDESHHYLCQSCLLTLHEKDW